MENIKKPSMSNIRRRWKTILALAVVASASFTAGTYANRVFVGLIQSIGGNRVLVPPPELSIFASTWSIDPQKSVVTDVDLLVTTNSSVWQLKLYQIHVQVSCLDETVTPPAEFICSTGQATVVLPTHGIGLRPIRILLDKPIDPETTEIHDLSYIVTDLGRVPPQPPTVFGGPNTVAVSVQQGGSVKVPIMVAGVAGVPSGTQVMAMLAGLPAGVTALPAVQNITLLADPSMPGTVMADSFFDVFTDSSAQVGTSDIQLKISGSTPGGIILTDDSTVQVSVFLGPLPNLHFRNCSLTTVNGVGCFSFVPSTPNTIIFVMENNGAAASSPTTVSVSNTTPGNPVPTQTTYNVPAMVPLGTSILSITCTPAIDLCGFTLTMDPANIVLESNEADNTISVLVHVV